MTLQESSELNVALKLITEAAEIIGIEPETLAVNTLHWFGSELLDPRVGTLDGEIARYNSDDPAGYRAACKRFEERFGREVDYPFETTDVLVIEPLVGAKSD